MSTSLRLLRSATLVVALVGLATPAVAGSQTGTITGVVKLLGKAPARKAIDMSSDSFCAKAPAATSEEVVSSDGKLADVFVRLQNGSAGSHKAPAAAIVIEQRGCMYRPRVVGAMVGQAIQIKNEDGTMHNVHGSIERATLFNKGQPKGSKPIDGSAAGKAGQVVELKCDVHSWMRSFIPITDHPYFAVTGADGSFTIADVPAGTYTLEAYHPKLGTKTTSVTVTAGKTATASFAFVAK